MRIYTITLQMYIKKRTIPNLCRRKKPKKQKKTPNKVSFAEGGGFEPPVRLPVRQFSKLVVSATHPSFPTHRVKLISCNRKRVQRYDNFFTCASRVQNKFIKSCLSDKLFVPLHPVSLPTSG